MSKTFIISILLFLIFCFLANAKNADLNNDMIVDGQDLQLFSKEFGKVYDDKIAFTWNVSDINNIESFQIYYIKFENGKLSKPFELGYDEKDCKIIDNQFQCFGIVKKLKAGQYFFFVIPKTKNGKNEYPSNIIIAEPGDQ